MTYEPDFRHMLDVLANRRPARLPVYEHIISPKIMEPILGVEFAALEGGQGADLDQFFAHYCRFWQEMTYDTVSYEVTITDQLPGHGAIMGGAGPIQSRADFERYPWDELAGRYWATAEPRLAALGRHLPPGMKALGGVGNGVFEISEDLVGFQYLPYIMADDPELFAEIYQKIGDLMVEIWTVFLQRHADTFAICRFGDDLGFKTSTLVSPALIRQVVIPQYARVIALIKAAGKPFLWHSCGKIFAIMDDVIALGINAKHSNEDVIAPYDEWIARYGDRIGLLGGIDVDILCRHEPAAIVEEVFTKGRRFRAAARGYALGSGNSIPDYVPVDGYLAMIEAARRIREAEAAGGAATSGMVAGSAAVGSAAVGSETPGKAAAHA
jgi:uroporphyrinogen decarboxylase